jgi:hypothetical protein
MTLLGFTLMAATTILLLLVPASLILADVRRVRAEALQASTSAGAPV